MSEDYFEIAYINDEEAILHGRRADYTRVRIALTDEQERAIAAMQARHHAQLQALLRGMAS